MNKKDAWVVRLLATQFFDAILKQKTIAEVLLQMYHNLAVDRNYLHGNILVLTSKLVLKTITAQDKEHCILEISKISPGGEVCCRRNKLYCVIRMVHVA